MLPFFTGFAASNEGMAGQPAIDTQPAAAPLRRLVQLFDSWTPAFDDPKDREFYRDQTWLAVVMFAITGARWGFGRGGRAIASGVE